MAAERAGQTVAAALQRPESPQGAPPATANCNSADGIAASGHVLAVEVAASNNEGKVNGLHSPFAADEQQNKSSGTPQQKAAQGVPASSPTASSPKQKQQRRVAKRPSADSNHSQQAANEPAAEAGTAADIEEDDQTETMHAVKRRKPAAAPAAAPEQQAHKQHPPDRSHIRQHHAVDGDDEYGLQNPTAPGSLEIEPSGVSAAAAAVPTGSPQQQGRQPQHHKRSKGQPKQLLSFTEEMDADEAAAAPYPAAAAAAADSSSQEQQLAAKQAHGSIARATANRFAQEATAQAAAAARTMFRPSGSAAGGAAGGGAAGAAGALLVDEDEDPRAAARAAAAAGLSQIHFGFATARGHRPYMEDRHTIITALNPATAQQAAAALEAAERPQAAAAAAAAAGDDSATAANGSGRQQQHASVAHDGVGRSYAAIFDGHNGAGAAETAARKLHLLLASHPALRLYRGETGPPAVVKQEEAAVGSALKQAFRQVDDMVLSTARHEGTRDGATALVLLRLGNVLYSAHAGMTRACRARRCWRTNWMIWRMLPWCTRACPLAHVHVHLLRARACWHLVNVCYGTRM
ncbi:hypothetical protein COO60DRAFT_44238 [Scenedesmus sp. NREL 46B-D3]|nr:hypothetical protein COO60DRAFT_44238 [Scenedesmus sp. NREL 46B-D3]